MRIDRLLANSGLGSRKEIKDLLRSGRVTLAGQTVTDPAYSLTEEQVDGLEIDGKPIRTGTHLYYALNKPTGYLTAMTDRSKATIGDLLPAYFTHKKVVPVGRLDFDTSGLLLLTNDGELHHRLLSPKYGIVRKYYLEVDLLDGKAFNEADVSAVAKGIRLNTEEVARPAVLEILSETSAYLSLTEGKFHEVKRMMHALAKEVRLLSRESYGPIELASSGDHLLRSLAQEEITALRQACRLR